MGAVVVKQQQQQQQQQQRSAVTYSRDPDLSSSYFSTIFLAVRPKFLPLCSSFTHSICMSCAILDSGTVAMVGVRWRAVSAGVPLAWDRVSAARA